MGEENKMGVKAMSEEETVEIDKDLLEFMKMELEEKKRKKEEEARKTATEKLQKYVLGLKKVPEKYNAKHIMTIVSFLSECDIEPPKAQHPSLIQDFKDNRLALVLLVGLIIVGIIALVR